MLGKIISALIVGYIDILNLAVAAESLDLIDSYRLAVERDAAYIASGFEELASRESEAQRLAQLLPKLSIGAQSTRLDVRHEAAGGELRRRGTSESYGIHFSQPIFNWKDWVGYKQGSKQKALGRVRYEIASQDLKLNVVRSYFEAVTAMGVLESLDSLSASLKVQLESAKMHFETGNGAIAEVNEAQASYDANLASIVQGKSDLSAARFKLEKLIGVFPEDLVRMADHSPVQELPESTVEEFQKAARAFNLRVQEYELLRDIAENNKEIAFSDHLPTLELVASHTMQQNPSAGITQSDSNMVGVRFSLPLYSGGGVSSRHRQATAYYQQSSYELLDIYRQVSVEVNQAWSELVDGIALIRALEAAKKSAISSVESNQLGYRIGVRMGIDVLDAQSRLSDVRQQLTRARYETLLAQLRLKSTVGNLSEADLLVVNNQLRQQ